MPIYEYECKSCGHRLEKLQRMNDPALTDCPACNQSELKRLVSAVAFRLKGSGWYETDFKKGDKKNLHDSGGTESGASTSGDSKAKTSDKSSDAKSSSKESGKGSAKESTTAATKKTGAA
jgi:putative FmdB family regulatory protein